MTHIFMPEVSPVAWCKLHGRQLSGKAAWERKLPFALIWHWWHNTLPAIINTAGLAIKRETSCQPLCSTW